MGMVCPQCSTALRATLAVSAVRNPPALCRSARRAIAPLDRPTRWQQRPWGRILIGLVLAQGLFYGLRHLLTAVLMALQGEEAVQHMWTAASGILLLQGVRSLALLGRRGSRRRRTATGLFLGALIGAWNGVLSVFVLAGPAQTLTTVAIFGQPLLQAAIGAVGGWLGSACSGSPLPADVPDAAPTRKRNLLRRPRKLFAGPVAWFRVAAGVRWRSVGT